MDDKTIQNLKEMAKESPLIWMHLYRQVNDQPYSVENGWWFQEEIADNTTKKVAVRKCAQAGLTENYLSFACWFLDTKSENALYTLPVAEMASDLSKTKFEKIIGSSPYLNNLIQDTDGGKKSDSVKIKKIKNNYFYIRGMSGSRTTLESISVGIILIDEYAKVLEQERIAMAKKRMKASRWKYERYFSTPLIPDDPIDSMYMEGNQKMWFVKCEHCNHEQSPEFFVHHNKFNLDPAIQDMDPHYVCIECHQRLNVLTRGRWIPQHPEGKFDSYWVTGTYVPDYAEDGSTRDSAAAFWEDWEQAQKDSDYLAEFYRQNLGVGYLSQNDKIEESEINACIRAGGGFSTSDVVLDNNSIYVLGADIGTLIHYVLLDVTDPIRHKVIDFGYFDGLDKFEDLMDYIKSVCPNISVIDLYPEVTLVRQMIQDNPGYLIKGAQEVTGLNVMTQPNTNQRNENNEMQNFILDYSKTITFDTVFGRIKKEKFLLPTDTNAEFKKHITNVVRVKDGEKYKYVGKTGYKRPDHYLSALGFAEIGFNSIALFKREESVGKIVFA